MHLLHARYPLLDARYRRKMLAVSLDRSPLVAALSLSARPFGSATGSSARKCAQVKLRHVAQFGKAGEETADGVSLLRVAKSSAPLIRTPMQHATG